MSRVQVRATYVEIPVSDLDRAEAFYRDLLGASTRRTVLDGHPACILDDDDGATHPGGALVALMHGESYVPSVDGTRVYITVENIEQILARTETLGGTVLYPFTRIDDGLAITEISDSEGNRIALSGR